MGQGEPISTGTNVRQLGHALTSSILYHTIKRAHSGTSYSFGKMGLTQSAFAIGLDGTYYEVRFSSEPFAQGSSQYAYKGTLLSPPTWNPDVVVKRFKYEFANYTQDCQINIKTSRKADELAKKFNSMRVSQEEISFHIPIPMKLNDYRYHQHSLWSQFLEQWVLVEPYIPGNFQKWLNNTGWVDHEAVGVGMGATLLPAFTHWTWVETKGELIVCDLQGVRDGNGYQLTDPAINSVSRSYGLTDLGQEGISQFFATHQCNYTCLSLGLTSQRPVYTNFSAQLAAIRGTTYWPTLRTVDPFCLPTLPNPAPAPQLQPPPLGLPGLQMP